MEEVEGRDVVVPSCSNNRTEMVQDRKLHPNKMCHRLTGKRLNNTSSPLLVFLLLRLLLILLLRQVGLPEECLLIDPSGLTTRVWIAVDETGEWRWIWNRQSRGVNVTRSGGCTTTKGAVIEEVEEEGDEPLFKQLRKLSTRKQPPGPEAAEYLP